jgi:hypothetical protein
VERGEDRAALRLVIHIQRVECGYPIADDRLVPPKQSC